MMMMMLMMGMGYWIMFVDLMSFALKLPEEKLRALLLVSKPDASNKSREDFKVRRTFP